MARVTVDQEADASSIFSYHYEYKDYLDYYRFIDPERAKEGPFGTTIAHGFLTLSLLPRFYATAYKVDNVRMGVNYGLNKVRFTSPVPAGSRLRAHMVLQACDAIDGNGMQLTWLVTVQREGAEKPVCVAESLTRLYA